MTMNRLSAAVLAIVLVGPTACAQPTPGNADPESAPMEAGITPAPAVEEATSVATPAVSTTPVPVPAATAATGPSTQAPAAGEAPAFPVVVVHKSPTCGCCGLWVEHLRQAGFEVDVRDTDNLGPIKEQVGVPIGKGSCHTAQVGNYFVEGHVPAADIRRLLTEQPAGKGLVVPGMPAGSPGMEVPSGLTQAYTVELVGEDGSTTAFSEH